MYLYNINHREVGKSKVADKLEECKDKVQGGGEEDKNDDRGCDKLKTHKT